MIKFLDFYADWCQPCKQMAPRIAELKEEFPGISVQEIDIDKEEDLVAKYEVMSVPTYIILDDNDEMTHRFIGVVSKKAIADALEENIL